jgi:argininosuccinate lyase
MPQKRNPVIFEHTVAKVSHVLGIFTSIITTMKGLPFTHTRATGGEVFTLLWKAFSETELTLNLVTLTLDELEIIKDNALANTKKNFSTVTEVADEIVRKMDVSFRTAHEIVKRAVWQLYSQGRTSEDLTLEELNAASMKILGKPLQNISAEVIAKALDPLENIKRRNVLGGPAPTEVAKNIETMRNKLQTDTDVLNTCRDRIASAEATRNEKIKQIKP